MIQGRNKSLRLKKNETRLIPMDISESIGKLPPQSLELEEAVLGALMLEKKAIMEIVGLLYEDDFYLEAHKVIFEAILSLYKQEKPIDMRTVVHELRASGRLEFLPDGAAYIVELTSKVSSAANIEYHARIVAEMSIKRGLIMMASTIHHDAYEDTTDVFELLDETQSSFDSIAGRYLKKRWKTEKQAYNEAIEHLLKSRNKTGLTGVASGYTRLDRVTGGWQKSDLIIIAARPAMGKTAFVVNVLRNAAVDFKIPVAVFSLEMTSLQLQYRMLSAESEVDLDNLIRANYSDQQWDQLKKTSRLSEAPIFIDDTPALAILELRAKARRLKAEHNIQLIVVDYLQLMRGDKEGNREQEISSISRGLKGVAKDLNVPVLALSQLSRGVETRGGDKRPQLSDLRESGAIEQDADIVMFLYRPEYYKISAYEDGMPTQGLMEVIIAKHRQGALDTVQLKFIGKYSKVSDFESFDAPKFLPINNQGVVSYKDRQVESRNEKSDDAPF